MFPPAHTSSSSFPILIPSTSKKHTVAKQIALQNLSYPLHYSKQNVVDAPEQLAQNACFSFTSLVEANLRQYFKLHILRQQQQQNDDSMTK
mmetsp:Transcript_2636/g.3831  ORF Transcript_2636/g.3831 Transcript_2636/m.3831 type:complete len:91 (-) Transcript_2636:959-1231(-)